jgi:hypothetical protein
MEFSNGISHTGLRSAKLNRTIAVLAALIMLVRVVHAMFLFSSTVDEPYHIASAVVLYDTGKVSSGVEQPPVTRLVSGLPLYLLGVHLPHSELTTAVVSLPETFDQGTEILFHNHVNYWKILWTARLSMLVFPLAGLLYLYLLAAWIGNEFIAALSVVFFSLDPTFLGNSAWVHNDVAACTAYLAAAYYGARWVVLGGMRRAIFMGIAVALAIATKFSCVVILPAIFLLMIVLPFWSKTSESPKTLRGYLRQWPPIAHLAAAALVAFVTIWGTYFFNVDRLSNQTLFNAAESNFLKIPLRVRNAEIPMPSFPLGLMALVQHSKANRDYLNGHFNETGWWYYFPEAIAIKEPLGLLAGLLVAGCLLWAPSLRAHRWRIAIILIPAGIFMAAVLPSHIDIGIRHVLPVLPFLYLLVCFTLVQAGRRGLAFLGVVITVALVESVWIAPNYAEFFNLLVGGPSQGAKYLLDSNLDHGQDIGQLAQWLHSDQAQGRKYSLRLFVFPDKSLVSTLGMDTGALFRNSDSGGLLAISKNIRYGLSPGVTEDWVLHPKEDYSWLSKYPIVKHIGYSIDVYDLDAPLRVSDGQ